MNECLESTLEALRTEGVPGIFEQFWWMAFPRKGKNSYTHLSAAQTRFGNTLNTHIPSVSHVTMPVIALGESVLL